MKVSVLVTTYNHEAFVREALDSVLAQRTTFDFEIVLCDDGSTDGTRSLLDELVAREPHRARRLPTHSNAGMTENLRRGFEACRGDYVAILEGDDYWISPQKLQAQAEFLDRHPQCSLNFTGLLVLTEDGLLGPFNFIEREQFSTEELIAHNFIANLSTCMYRRALIEKLPSDLFETYAADWIINLAFSVHGPIGCIPLQMTAYRRQGQGHWAGMSREDQLVRQIALIPDYDAVLDHRFTDEFDRLEAELSRKLERQRYLGLLAERRYARAVRRYPALFGRSLLSALRAALVPPALTRSGRRITREPTSPRPFAETERLAVPRIR